MSSSTKSLFREKLGNLENIFFFWHQHSKLFTGKISPNHANEFKTTQFCLCLFFHNFTKANNKCLLDSDSWKEASFVVYVDANNLYGWAMSQPLPYKDFKYMSSTDIDSFDIHNIPIVSKYGYFLEVDLIYPYRSIFIMIFHCLASKEDMVKK